MLVVSALLLRCFVMLVWAEGWFMVWARSYHALFRFCCADHVFPCVLVCVCCFDRGTVTYLDIHDDPAMTIGIFQLPPGARMPLHDHPGMTVFSR